MLKELKFLFYKYRSVEGVDLIIELMVVVWEFCSFMIFLWVDFYFWLEVEVWLVL